MTTNLAKHLSSGEVCVFETDTVVGIGCSAYVSNNSINFRGVERIFKIKKRDPNKKLPWLISSVEMLKNYIEEVSFLLNPLLGNGWPDKTTLILKTKPSIPEELTINSTIAFRIPSNKKLQSIIDEVGYPIITTSANFSGEGPYSFIADVPQGFLNHVDYYSTENFFTAESDRPRASKIIDATGAELKIIRN